MGADEMFDLSSLGLLIKSYMVRRGISRVPDLIDKVEQHTGFVRHENTYGHYMKGEREPSLSFLIAVMLTLSIPLSELEESLPEKHRADFRSLVR